MKLSLYFLRKFFCSPRQEWKRPGSLFMVLGIIISVATLTIAFTIFDGYEHVLKKSILSTNSHLYVFSNRRADLTESDKVRLIEFFASKPEVEAVQGTIITQAMAANPDPERMQKVISCQIRSVNWREEQQAVTYKEFVEKGSWELTTRDFVVIGSELADRLGIRPGDEILLVSPAQNKMTLMGLKSPTRTYTIAGLYHSGMYEMDSRVVFMQPSEAWQFSNQPQRYSRMEVKLYPDQINRADYLSYIWLNELELDYQVLSWQDFNSSLFNLLKLEKWLLFFVLSFLIVVASFNVVSAVSTQIIDRRRDIGILKTIGFSNKSLHSILLGRIVGTGLLAALVGEILGILLSWAASVQGFFKLKGDVYFLDKINVHYSPPAMLLILVTAFIIIMTAALIPLCKLNRLEITSILRN